MLRGAVLEGCSAAGKTSVLKALKRVQAERDLERSVVVVAEHYSQALHKLAGTYTWLPLEEHRKLLDERLEALEALARWSSRLGGVSRFLEEAKRSPLPTRILPTDDQDWERCAREILDYL
jgi:thymidylate kinase